MDDRIYFRQLLSGRDFAQQDQVARQMVNFVYPMWSQVVDNDEFDKMVEVTASRKASAQ